MDRYRPPLVITALGSPAPAVERVHAYGGAVFADVSSLAFARKAAATGVDGLVLVSAGAGGHTGKVSPFAFVQAVREFYDGIVVLGGSIGHGGAVRAAELLGADLAYAGTPFIVAKESLAAPLYRDMVVRASFEDLVLTKTFTGCGCLVPAREHRRRRSRPGRARRQGQDGLVQLRRVSSRPGRTSGRRGRASITSTRSSRRRPSSTAMPLSTPTPLRKPAFG